MSEDTAAVLAGLVEEMHLRVNATRITTAGGLGWRDGMHEAARMVEAAQKRLDEGANGESETTTEEWRPIVGAPNHEVSNLGRVRSKDHWISCGPDYIVPQFKPGQILRPGTSTRGGRPVATFRINGKRKTRFIHTLVAEAFIGPRPIDLMVCHNDGDPTNNVPSNLRYDTSVGNAQDAIRHKTNFQLTKTHCVRNHPLEHPNLRQERSGRRRRCLACSRARNYLRTKPDADLQTVSDSYYAAIKAEVAE